MIEYIYLIKLFLAAWVLSSWSVSAIENITLKPFSDEPKNLFHMFGRLFYTIGLYILSCPKCFSFWFILILSGNFFIAAGISFAIMWVDKVSQNIKTRL